MGDLTQIEGIVSNIQRFSLDDGPGIRTTVFLKGCNLKCLWCHNPESIDPKPEIQFFQNNCTSCGRCAEICPQGAQGFPVRGINRVLCLRCGLCQKKCPRSAIAIVGSFYSVNQIMDIVKKDVVYYDNSLGGVTFSGGEPMLQMDFLEALLQESRQLSLHTAVDTAGNVSWERFLRILPYTDLFLYDIKLFNEQKHQAATGVDNRLILKNLVNLSEERVDIIVRVPVIVGINDDYDELSAIAGFLKGLNIKKVQLLPYHSYGLGKYETIGMECLLSCHTPPSDGFMEEAAGIFTAVGLCAQVG